MSVSGGVVQGPAVTAETLLGEADHLLRGSTDQPGVWPRAAAILIRTALEMTLDNFWATKLPEAAGSSMKAQLLLLREVAGRDTAERATDAWTGLSRAAHHHSYELCPTAAELRRWHDLVILVGADLSAKHAVERS